MHGGPNFELRKLWRYYHRMDDRCPVCGSRNRAPIAPGFWRCAGEITQTGLIPVPDENGPRSHTGEPLTTRLIPWECSVACLNEYHDGRKQRTPLCKNYGDTYSIGICQKCRQPVCGKISCSDTRDQARLCIQDALQHDEELERAEAERKHQLLEESRREEARLQAIEK